MWVRKKISEEGGEANNTTVRLHDCLAFNKHFFGMKSPFVSFQTPHGFPKSSGLTLFVGATSAAHSGGFGPQKGVGAEAAMASPTRCLEGDQPLCSK